MQDQYVSFLEIVQCLMKRLVFIVEGDSEIILLQNIIVPYLIELGLRIDACSNYHD